MLLLATCIPLFLMGQTEVVDSLSGNFVTEDTIFSESTVKTPELQIDDVPKNISPASPMIPMNIDGIKQFDITMLPRYWGYENMFGYKAPELRADKLNLDFSTFSNNNLYNNQYRKLSLNLNFAPSPNILELIRENPLRALLYGMATVAGMMNNTIMGEDKMNKIRLDNMVQSHSGIPETMIPGQTINFEIDIKKKK
jgi:hypothetical protein